MSPRDDGPGDRGSWGGSGRDRDQQRVTHTREDETQTKIDREKLEVLDGSRNDKLPVLRRAAVRIEDLTGLLQMPTDKMQSVTFDPAGPAPTAADYNLLRRDVAVMYQQLLVVGAALSKRLK